ncbi:hypothetical protein AURDEDRAFT_117862 [Auricularia subglabra TFB-10046 SS5]|uniref:Uncharacterized protein n=1 Tax=Auricularia subglabra (strain TFB-10046 / SS5) TaxID=717982 RepID=J0LAP0_AURST|nr:hypothetical protein AURDEDRAFT_117862 [Auricularia subglabra TFB-10046 SS5]
MDCIIIIQHAETATHQRIGYNRRYGRRVTGHLRANDKSTTARITQCLSGYARTGEYKKAINTPERGFACCCGAVLQNHDHLTGCPQYERYRGVLSDMSPSLSVTQLLGTPASIATTAKFLRRSGAFGRPT